jgi:hypothetical protein
MSDYRPKSMANTRTSSEYREKFFQQSNFTGTPHIKKLVNPRW